MSNSQYSLNLQTKSRGKGKSAADSVSYITRARLVDITTGLVCDSREKKDLVYENLFLPDGAAPEWQDPQKLCDAIELYSNSSSARVLKTLRGSLPNELSLESKIAIVNEVGEELKRQGMCVALGIHNPPPKFGKRNWHVHFATSTKPCKDGKFVPGCQTLYKCKKNGEEVWLTSSQLDYYKTTSTPAEKIYKYYPKGSDPSKKENYLYLTPSEYKENYSEEYERVNKHPVKRKDRFVDWDTDEWLIQTRKLYADICNKYLELEGSQTRWSEKSYKDQGVEKVPTKHLGTNVADMERKQPGSTRVGRYNMAVAERNESIEEINYLLENDEITMTPQDVAAAKQMKKEILENEESGAVIIGPEHFKIAEIIKRALEQARQLFFIYKDEEENCFIVFLKSAAETILKIIDKAVGGLEGVLSTAEEKSKETDNQKDTKPIDYY